MALTERLKLAEVERKQKEAEFRKKQRVLDDFPQILKTLEEATIPLQDYLNVKVTEESLLQERSEKLPLAMNTVFRKLYNFAKQYPHFGLEVLIQNTTESDTTDTLETFYQSQKPPC